MREREEAASEEGAGGCRTWGGGGLGRRDDVPAGKPPDTGSAKSDPQGPHTGPASCRRRRHHQTHPIRPSQRTKHGHKTSLLDGREPLDPRSLAGGARGAPGEPTRMARSPACRAVLLPEGNQMGATS